MKVEYINHMGNDNAVVDSARVSFAKQASNYTDEQNNKLISYLAKHNHWSPFTHTAITLRMQAPIAIHAQVMKHTVGFSHNTVSRRYVSDKPELFMPTFREATDKVKQGSLDKEHELNDNLREIYEAHCLKAIELYESFIKHNVPPEQARFILPQGVMTEWISTGSLYAWARFYNLRSDSHAQKEIRNLAYMVEDIIEPLFPISWRALTKGM